MSKSSSNESSSVLSSMLMSLLLGAMIYCAIALLLNPNISAMRSNFATFYGDF